MVDIKSEDVFNHLRSLNCPINIIKELCFLNTNAPLVGYKLEAAKEILESNDVIHLALLIQRLLAKRLIDCITYGDIYVKLMRLDPKYAKKTEHIFISGLYPITDVISEEYQVFGKELLETKTLDEFLNKLKEYQIFHNIRESCKN